MKLAYIHFTRADNVGDLLSAPYYYFKFAQDGQLYDLAQAIPPIEYDAAIFGGGALAGRMANYGAHKRVNAKKLIGWGIGRSLRGVLQHNKAPHPYPEDMDLLGLRDYWPRMPKGSEWVPCASCMHPAFEADYEVRREAVGFFNAAMPLPPTGLKAIMSNRQSTLEKVLGFLGSAETVVTNSYHGAYWATLLGRKVIIVNPYSSKFFDLRWKTKTASASEWKTAGKLKTYPDALAEARAANSIFYDKVMGVLNDD